MTTPNPPKDDDYVRRGGFYVPTDTADAPQLRGALSNQRDLVAVTNDHQWRQLAQDAEHGIRLADVAELAARAKRARKQRAKDARDAVRLADLYRTAKNSGSRAKIRADILGSAEMRALRVARVRTIALIAGIPILLAFAAWSTTGVQAGVVKLLGLGEGDPSWWTAWLVEPGLIAIVALIIIGRAVLRSSGGDTDWKADVAEWAALGTSLSLNMYGGWDGTGWAGFGPAVTHSIGPIFAAGTAFLIGLFDGYVTQATPWDGASRLDELNLVADVEVRPDVVGAPLQIPVTHLPELPAGASATAGSARDGTRRGASAVGRRDTGRKGLAPGRGKSASRASTSGDADQATRAAQLVLTQGLSNREAAAKVGGTSEASVRRRVNKLREERAGDAPDRAASAEIFVAPIPDPEPSMTHGVNGYFKETS